MPKFAFTPHEFDPSRGNAGGVAVREKASKHRKIPVSPHLLDLKAAPPTKAEAAAARKAAPKPEAPPSAPRGVIGRIRHMLDEKVHLHDLRMRTLSIRPRGWKDFPPAGATTLFQAVRITASRFFNEHPLADLTIVSVAHLSVLAVWHIVKLPAVMLSARAAEARAEAMAPRLESTPAFLPMLELSEAVAEAEPEVIVLPAEDEAVEPVAAAAKEPKKAPFTWTWFPLQLQPGWQRSVAGFAAVAALLIVPLGVYGSFGSLRDGKDRLVSDSIEAMGLIKAAGEAAKGHDFAAASEAFGQARDNFDGAKKRLGALATMLNAAPAVLPGTPVSAIGPLLSAGREVAAGGERLATGLAALEAAEEPAQKLDAVKGYLRDAMPHLEKASREIAKVAPEAVPEAYRGQVTDARKEIPRLAASVRKANDIADVLGALMGNGSPKRYLVIFQNNAELRPTGGFMGSFALVDVHDGKVKSMEIPGGGTYDLKGSLTARLSSPQPLHLINQHWQFQDSNWYPDFPTSAKQIEWFYGKSKGPSIDGVIAMTATFMEKLLAVTGPIAMPEYGKTITAQNFFYETQKAVEMEYDKTANRPKQFIADMAPKVLERIMTADRGAFMTLAGTLDESLTKKDIQLWMKDASVQSRLSALGWTGEMRPSDGDYLAIVHTNIAGQKTDLVMKDEVHHAVKVLPDGTGIVTLTIARTHTGERNALFSGVRNVDYLRVYVPKGSTLVEARGFEQPDPKLFKITDAGDSEDPAIAAQELRSKLDRASGTRTSEESGRTVFGNWVQTDPGETSVVTLVYQLPAGSVRLERAEKTKMSALSAKLGAVPRDRLDYSLLVQKQAGANPAAFTTSVDLPRGFYPSRLLPARKEDDRGRWTTRIDLDRDAYFGTAAEAQ